MNKNYDDSDLKDIMRHSYQLRNRSFLDVLQSVAQNDDELSKLVERFSSTSNKGGLGTLLEEFFYGYTPNSKQDADFDKVGVELKVTPFEKNASGECRAGERLVISMIPNDEEIPLDFEESTLKKKISQMLTIWYERNKELTRLAYQIKELYYYNLYDESLKNDLAVIKEDFKIISQKIRAGLAHELSEGDTRYLGACTKGATAAKSLQPQFYNTSQPAKRRAYSLKQSYMTFVLNNYVLNQADGYESIFENNELVGSSFDDEIKKKISFFYGMDEESLYRRFDLTDTSAKQKNKMLVNRMLGVNTDAAEFRKASIIVKTIRVQKNGLPKESMSFANVSISDFINNVFDESKIYQFFEEARFLFVIFHENDDGKYILRKSMFWNMPLSELENQVKEEWIRYKECFEKGVCFTITPNRITNNLPKKEDTQIFHLRPRAQHAGYVINGVKHGKGEDRDMDTLPNGDKMTAQCFWLNNDYIAKIIR